jgi:hypothetical protein
MAQQPVIIEDGKSSPAPQPGPVAKPGGHPAPEEQLGGGDICSLEEQPSTDDDTPLE